MCCNITKHLTILGVIIYSIVFIFDISQIIVGSNIIREGLIKDEHKSCLTLAKWLLSDGILELLFHFIDFICFNIFMFLIGYSIKIIEKYLPCKKRARPTIYIYIITWLIKTIFIIIYLLSINEIITDISSNTETFSAHEDVPCRTSFVIMIKMSFYLRTAGCLLLNII